MARNGAGTYVLPAGNPVVTGATISSTWANNTLNDMATALTQSISTDGQTTPSGNLPMGGYNHTNVAPATAQNQYASAQQVLNSSFQYLTSISGTNAIVATAGLGMGSYVTGSTFRFLASSTNTGASTLNINNIGALAITKNGTSPLVAGDIVSGAMVQVVYDGTEFQMVSPSAIPTVSSFSAGSTGLTPSTATTGAVTLAGTLAVANGGTGSTTSTGSGAVVLATSPTLTTATLTSPTLTTPALGTPSAVVLTNATGTANSLNAGIGVSQTWTDVTSSRAAGTTYTNSTGKPIQVFINMGTSGGGTCTMTVGGLSLGGSIVVANNSSIVLSFIVPNSTTYVLTVSGSSVTKWTELR